MDYLQSCSIAGEFSASTLEKLHMFLSPYFFSQHSVRGDIPGPFTKLRSQELQRRALEMGWWFVQDGGSGAAKLEDGIARAVVHTKNPDLITIWNRMKAGVEK